MQAVYEDGESAADLHDSRVGLFSRHGSCFRCSNGLVSTILAVILVLLQEEPLPHVGWGLFVVEDA